MGRSFIKKERKGGNYRIIRFSLSPDLKSKWIPTVAVDLNRWIPTVAVGLNRWIPTVAVGLNWLFGSYFVNF